MNKLLYNEPTKIVGIKLESELHDRAVTKARLCCRTLGNWIVTIIEEDVRNVLLNADPVEWVLYRLHIASDLLDRAKQVAKADRRSLGEWVTVQMENDISSNPPFI
jgi:predicted HicB family RNase H-like nuclease